MRLGQGQLGGFWFNLFSFVDFSEATAGFTPAKAELEAM